MIHGLLHEGLGIGRKAAMEIKVITADGNDMPRGLSVVQ
jgi:hypothetical protein